MHTNRRAVVAATAALLLTGCGSSDGGAASSCAYVRGDSNCSPIVGGCNNTVAINDGDLTTAGTFSAQSGGFLAAGGSAGTAFSGGTNAGVFLTPPEGLSLTDITIGTYMDSEDGGVVESATGPALTRTPTDTDPATDYISFETSQPFNGVRLTVNTPNSTEFVVYEFCGAATVR